MSLTEDLLRFLSWLGLRFFSERRRARRAATAAGRAPVMLKDGIERVPPSLWRAIPLDLPYPGALSVSLDVVQGNPVDVALTTPEQIDALERDGWNNIPVYTDFSAVKTRTYRRSVQLDEGNYCLVMRDSPDGVPSSSGSEVRLKARLNP